MDPFLTTDVITALWNEFGLIPLAFGALWLVGMQANFESMRSASYPSETATREAQGTPRVLIICPHCAAVLGVIASITGKVVCASCNSTFACSTMPRRVPAWIIGTMLVGLWLLITRPWIAGAVSPGMFAVWSIIATTYAFMIPIVSRRRRRERRLRQIDFDVFVEISLALLSVACVSIAFAVLNAFVAGLAPLPNSLVPYQTWLDPRAPVPPVLVAEQDTTIRAALAAQRLIGKYLETTKSLKIGLWIGVAIFFIASVLLSVGRKRLFDRVIKGHKLVSRGLSIASLVAVTIGAFSLAGASVGEGVSDAAYSHVFEVNARSTGAVEKLTENVARSLAGSAVEDAIGRRMAPSSLCATDARGSLQCPTDLLQALHDQAARAHAQEVAWPTGADTIGLPATSPSADPGHDAARTAAALSRLGEAESRSPKSPVLAPIDQLLDSHIFAVDAASRAIGPPAGNLDASPAKGRFGDLVDIAVGLVFELLPIDLGPHLGRAAGPLPDAIAANITDAVRAPFANAVRAVVVDSVNSCASSADACGEFVRGRIELARHDPHVVTFGEHVATVIQPAMANWLAKLQRARTANDQADAMLQHAAAPALVEERQSEWGEMRQRWRTRSVLSQGGSAGGDTAVDWDVAALLESWDQTAVFRAVNQRAADKQSTPDAWDGAFLDFLNEDPGRAATFAYILLNDQPALARLLRSNPAVDARRLTYDAVYLMFATAVHPAPSDRSVRAETSVVNDRRFTAMVKHSLPNSPEDINFPPPPPSPPEPAHKAPAERVKLPG